MKIKLCAYAFAAAIALPAAANATTTVYDFTGANYWVENGVQNGGSASIVDVTGAGGNLENNAPLGTGVVKLSTGASNQDKAQVGFSGGFGTVGDFLNGGSISYDYYNAGGNTNQAAAASFKFTIIDYTGGGTGTPVQFVYEPYWNIVPNVSTNPTAEQWHTETITGSSGILWHTGYGPGPSQAGDGSQGKTLQDWFSYFGGSFLSASIVEFSIGIGTYNMGTTSYFDNVFINSGNYSDHFDFEVSVVPLPAALPLYGAGVALLGFVGWRRRQKAA